VVAFVVDMGFFLKPGSVCDICFNSDYRLDAVLHTGHIELYGSVHCAMVGQSYCGHTILFRELDHILDLGEAVKERVVGVSVEMNEFHNLILVLCS